MTCAPFRDALSARLDGEDPGVDAGLLDGHLAGCPSCRAWQEAAAEVTRRTRLVPAPRVPDVTAAVLAGLPAPRPARRWWVGTGLRLALGVVGALQLGLVVPALAGADPVDVAGPGPMHLAHETTAWNLGLAACFLVVAAAPRLAAGSLPFLLSFTAVLGWVTVTDLRAGHVHLERAGAHLLVLGGAVLVSVLAARGRGWGWSPAPASGRGPARAPGPRAGVAPGSPAWPAAPGARRVPGGSARGAGARAVTRSAPAAAAERRDAA